MSHGQVCYLEIPSNDAAASAAFYSALFGWKMRARGDGATAFDDTTGSVSGSFVGLDRLQPASPGVLIYVKVDDVSAAADQAEALGATIVQPVGADAPELTARFRDPSGNVLGLYQEPPG